MASRSAIVFLLGLALAAAGCDRQRPGDGQATAAHNDTSPDEVQPASKKHGAHNAVDRHQRGMAAVDSVFISPEGKRVRLADFRGKPVLLNLWATWCAPCVKELPTLDTLGGQLGDRVTMLAVSQDMEPAKVAPFVAARHLTRLKPYTDPEMGLSLGYRVNLPTTILFDAKGHEIWRTSGEMDWTSAAARKLIDEAF
ncbi:TlpA family protein disulfide reductase [Sphingomonas sp. MMSM20]|uniref:TlpA family protein disulfide reductase n=1 Tax=Sphingomonas lycopersici TaxID=2951807 RepID=UPI002237B0FA|nr:TlpA disulfide reductase family protein [Sphingomonas lycopersici]MCW6531199.1 TlpA family protein disulfide reductase [Sphingomonas lycopersici]